MQAYTILMIVGAVIVAGSFVFAIINMGRHASTAFGGDMDRAFSGFGGTFARHAGAMIGMVIGGFVFVVGLIMFLVQLIN